MQHCNTESISTTHVTHQVSYKRYSPAQSGVTPVSVEDLSEVFRTFVSLSEEFITAGKMLSEVWIQGWHIGWFIGAVPLRRASLLQEQRCFVDCIVYLVLTEVSSEALARLFNKTCWKLRMHRAVWRKTWKNLTRSAIDGKVFIILVWIRHVFRWVCFVLCRE